MKLLFQLATVLPGGLLGLAGAALLISAIWLADQEYFDILNSGVLYHTFMVNGHVVPMSFVILGCGSAGSGLLALSVLIIRYGIVSDTHNDSVQRV